MGGPQLSYALLANSRSNLPIIGEQIATSMYFPSEGDRLMQIRVIKANAAIAVATVTSAWYSTQVEIPENKVTILIIRIVDFNRAEPAYYKTNFLCAISGENGAFWYIVLRIMLLTYTRAKIRFSNRGGLSQMGSSVC